MQSISCKLHRLHLHTVQIAFANCAICTRTHYAIFTTCHTPTHTHTHANYTHSHARFLTSCHTPTLSHTHAHTHARKLHTQPRTLSHDLTLRKLNRPLLQKYRALSRGNIGLFWHSYTYRSLLALILSQAERSDTPRAKKAYFEELQSSFLRKYRSVLALIGLFCGNTELYLKGIQVSFGTHTQQCPTTHWAIWHYASWIGLFCRNIELFFKEIQVSFGTHRQQCPTTNRTPRYDLTLRKLSRPLWRKYGALFWGSIGLFWHS